MKKDNKCSCGAWLGYSYTKKYCNKCDKARRKAYRQRPEIIHRHIIQEIEHPERRIIKGRGLDPLRMRKAQYEREMRKFVMKYKKEAKNEA